MTKGHLIILFVLSFVIIVIFQVLDKKSNIKNNNIESRISNTQTHSQTPHQKEEFDYTKSKTNDNLEIEPKLEQQTLDGYNPIFRDKAEIQIAWMHRGQSIVLENNPLAESANFRNSYFHRSFNNRPVTCGEVQFINKDASTSDFQKFIYLGLRSTHLEHKVKNFNILWNKMCEQTSVNMKVTE